MQYNDYIALSNPDAAIRLCEDYGVNINPDDPNEISEGLSIIVSESGEKGLKDVMDIHPDKKIIIELAQKAKKHLNFIGSDDECTTCSEMNYHPKRNSAIPFNYHSASGDPTATASVLQTSVMMQQSTFMLLGIAVIGGILLFKK
jgi:hypothetical protein